MSPICSGLSLDFLNSVRCSQVSGGVASILHVRSLRNKGAALQTPLLPGRLQQGRDVRLRALSLATPAAATGLVYMQFRLARWATYNPSLQDRTALGTGATTGLGGGVADQVAE
jgi:hypothetical protein